MAAKELTDYQMEQLRRKIWHAEKAYNILQKKYRKQTGKNFVSSGPLPKPDVDPSWNPCRNNQGCFLSRDVHKFS